MPTEHNYCLKKPVLFARTVKKLSVPTYILIHE